MLMSDITDICTILVCTDTETDTNIGATLRVKVNFVQPHTEMGWKWSVIDH